MTTVGWRGTTGRSLSWRIVRSRSLGRPARWVSHHVVAAPRWSPLRLLSPVRARLRGEVDVRRLHQILTALESAGITYWLAGGWGVDALVGRQTRRHDDADLVIDDFDRAAPAACSALSALGFELDECHHQPVWMPDQWTLVDGRGATIDLVSLSWDLLRSAGPRPPLPEKVFDVGTVGGRSVPCLSATTQRLFHSGFPLRHVHRHDLHVLA